MSEAKKVALITGATRGLGASLSLKLGKLGYCIVGVARGNGHEDQWANAQKNYGAILMKGDVGMPEVACAAVELCRQHGELEVLINCSGSAKFGGFRDLSNEDLSDTLSSNLLGALYFSKEFLMPVSDNTRIIVNVMSTASFASRPNEVAYSAAKWGMRGFTEALRAELKGEKTKVMGVYPGGMQTSFWDHADPDLETENFIPPNEVAAAIVDQIGSIKTGYISDIIINRS